MKLTEVRIGLDYSKAMFYFTAEGRVDFRDLVKDLAQHLQTRVELRQIGVRDEAKVLGIRGLAVARSAARRSSRASRRSASGWPRPEPGHESGQAVRASAAGSSAAWRTSIRFTRS